MGRKRGTLKGSGRIRRSQSELRVTLRLSEDGDKDMNCRRVYAFAPPLDARITDQPIRFFHLCSHSQSNNLRMSSQAQKKGKGKEAEKKDDTETRSRGVRKNEASVGTCR